MEQLRFGKIQSPVELEIVTNDKTSDQALLVYNVGWPGHPSWLAGH
jgi:hypothetical protein